MKMNDLEYIKKFWEKGKEECIVSFKRKIENLFYFHKNGYKDEALTLCCLYIEALAKMFRLNNKRGDSKKEFCKALILNGGNEIFKKISLKYFLESIRNSKDPDICNIYNAIKNYFHELKFDIDHMVCIDQKNDLFPDCFRKTFEEGEVLSFFDDLKIDVEKINMWSCLWKGSVASMVYDKIRCNLVHLAIVESIRVDEVPLDFTLLYEALKSMSATLIEKGINRFEKDFGEKVLEKLNME